MSASVQEEKKQDDEKVDKVVIEKPDKALLDKLTSEMAQLFNYQVKYENNDNGSVTFWPTPPEQCKKATKKLPQTNSKIALEKVCKKFVKCEALEACSNEDEKVVFNVNSMTHSFIKSSLLAWSRHYPFRFRVEHIWLLILQAIAVHVDKNAEKLRSKYVNHSGKKELIVDRPNFVLHSPKNDWNGVVNEFAQQIDKNTKKDIIELFDCNFPSKTSLKNEQIATKIAIMDICKNYFKYTVQTMCGFPEITIDGTKQDWIALKKKCIKLLDEKVEKNFGENWKKSLIPLIDRFIAAFDGDICGVFWNSMIKRGATSGSGAYKYYCGWINILFPYLKERENGFNKPYSIDKSYVQQGFVENYNSAWGDGHGGGDMNNFPIGLSTAPVQWDYLGKVLKLKFISGFIGYKQNEKTLELCPNISWCIAHEDKV